MPTGYTANIAKGIDFRTYALDCARAFGACIMLRDEPPGGDKIPDEFQPSDYHVKALESANVSLCELLGMSDEECQAASLKQYAASEMHRAERLSECRALRSKYDAMLANVDGWEPPTSEHEELKKFMRNQIEISMSDCNESYYYEPTKQISGSQWRLNRQQSLERDICRHTKELAEERLRAAQRTMWVKALRDSLK